MRTPPGSADPLAALADELGQIGRPLDGMGSELLALRSGPAGPGPEMEAAPWSRKEDARAAEGVASNLDPVSAGVATGAEGSHPVVAQRGDAPQVSVPVDGPRLEPPAGERPAAAVTGTTPRPVPPPDRPREGRLRVPDRCPPEQPIPGGSLPEQSLSVSAAHQGRWPTPSPRPHRAHHRAEGAPAPATTASTRPPWPGSSTATAARPPPAGGWPADPPNG